MSVSTTENVVALTFDDGPHPEYTPRLLDLLEKHKAHATFFVVGKSAQGNPDILRRLHAEGHAIANHSWDHPSFPLITASERVRQIRACECAISPSGAKIFRPPYVEQSLASRLTLLRLGYQVVLFSVEVGDWWDSDSKRMAGLLATRTRPGSIVILHDALLSHASPGLVPRLVCEPYVDRVPMLTALEMFLEGEGKHFRFVTIPELIRFGSPQRENWFRTTQPGSLEKSQCPQKPK